MRAKVIQYEYLFFLNHLSNGRDLSLFPVLDYYKYNGANYHDDDFWQKYLL